MSIWRRNGSQNFELKPYARASRLISKNLANTTGSRPTFATRAFIDASQHNTQNNSELSSSDRSLSTHATGDFASLIERMASSQHSSSSKVGHIDVIMGPMFAGKSTALLARVSELEAEGKKILLVKSALDKRYSESSIATHDGAMRPCVAIQRLMDLDGALPSGLASFDGVAIDEAQFFPDLLEFAVFAAEKLHLTVVLAGLDGCFKREKFGQMLDVVPLADTVRKLHARCHYCSKGALFSLRLTQDDRKEVVGGSDVYRPVCRTHYTLYSNAREVAMAEMKGGEGAATGGVAVPLGDLEVDDAIASGPPTPT